MRPFNPSRAAPQAKIAEEDPIVRTAELTNFFDLPKFRRNIACQDQVWIDFASDEDIE